MMARSHVVVGAAAWIATAPLLKLPPFDAVLLAVAVAGALSPDLDHPQSWVGRRTRPVSTMLAALLGHRGVTHSALAVLGLAALAFQVGALQAGPWRGAAWAFVVGYLSHLAADLLTPRGLRLAWPLRRTWSLPLCRPGSAMEPLIVVVLAGGIAWRVFHGWR